MEKERMTPKMLEILPIKLVQAILNGEIPMDTVLETDHADAHVTESKNCNTYFAKYSARNRKFKKDALASLNRAASLFVIYITTVAHDLARSHKRSTVLERDLLEALRLCLFWEIEKDLILAHQISDNNESIKDDISEKDEITATTDRK